MSKPMYLTHEQYEEAKLQAVKEVPKILENLTLNTFDDMPESVGFQEAYKNITAKSDRQQWNMALMYEYGRIAGIRAEREKRRKSQKREELKERYPDMATSIDKASSTAIHIVGVLETMTADERNTFRDFLEIRAKKEEQNPNPAR